MHVIEKITCWNQQEKSSNGKCMVPQSCQQSAHQICVHTLQHWNHFHCPQGTHICCMYIYIYCSLICLWIHNHKTQKLKFVYWRDIKPLFLMGFAPEVAPQNQFVRRPCLPPRLELQELEHVSCQAGFREVGCQGLFASSVLLYLGPKN